MELFAEAARVLQGEKDQDSAALRAAAMSYQAFFMAWLGLSNPGYELAKEGIERLQQLNRREALVIACDSLILHAYFLGRHTEALKATKLMLRTATETDDAWLLAFTLFAASMDALLRGDYAEVKQLARTNLNLNEEIGDVIGSTLLLTVLDHAALASDEHEEARGFYLRFLKISEETDFYWGMQTSSKYLGKVAISMGKIAEAEDYLIQCLRITNEIGFVRDSINLFYEFARLRVAQHHTEQAVKLLALVLQHPTSYQARLLEGRIRDSAKDLLAKLEEEMPREAYAAALERGQELEIDGVVAELLGPKH